MSDLTNTAIESTYMIKCVKAGNAVEVYYAFLFDREFWAQIDQAAQFEDLTMAVTKLEAIAAGETDDGVFISLKDQLEADVAQLLVIRKEDNAIMMARSFWDESMKPPEVSKDSDAFLLKVVRENEDDVYINVTEDAEIDLTVNVEEAARYGDVNLVRLVIQQLQDASIGEMSASEDAGDGDHADGWSQLKLNLCRRAADYTQGVVLDEEGKPLSTLQMHQKVTLEIVDVNREETIETHLMRTVVMVAGAHHFAFRVIRSSMSPLWLAKDGTVDEEFDRDYALIVDSQEGRLLIEAYADLDQNPEEGEELSSFQKQKRSLTVGADSVWIEMVDIEAQQVVHSAWLKVPLELQPVKL
jgi:hypothetical protein